MRATTPGSDASPLSDALRACRPLFHGAFFLGFFINMLLLSVSLYSMQVFDRVLSSGSLETLMMLSIMVAIAILFMGVLQWLNKLVFAHAGRFIEETLSGAVVARTMEITLHKPNIGVQPLRDLSTIKGFVTSPALGSAFDAPWAILFFIVIFLINVTVGWFVVLGAVILLVLAVCSERVPKGRLSRANDEQVKAMQMLDGALRNAEVVRSMGFQSHALAKWRKHDLTGVIDGFAAANASNLIATLTRNIRLAIQTFLTGLAAWLVIRGDLSAGAIIAITMLSGKALAPFDAFVAIYAGWLTAAKAFDRLKDIFAATAAVGDRKVELPAPAGRITLDKITYQDRGSGRWLLRGVNIDIAPGEAIGVIGQSGSGKTTLARLITGVFKPTSGAVRLDGGDIEQWEPAQLGKYIGYLPQDVELFEGTVAENIARLDPGVDDGEIVAAARMAQVHDFILTLPAGYQTEVGRGGASLSAGQRQRVALARCFLKHVRVAVLDEPNSNLDSEGEAALIEALQAARGCGITTITIAHRPAVLQKVDKILVLHAGEAKLFGPAQDVLNRLTGSGANIHPLRKAESAENTNDDAPPAREERGVE